jgi:hypothetical protein
MLNKTIVVFYVNVGNLEQSDVSEYIKKVHETIKPLDEDKDSVIHYVIPIRGDQETKVECINAPIIITSEEQKYEILLKMEKMNNKLDRITSYINAECESRTVLTEKK